MQKKIKALIVLLSEIYRNREDFARCSSFGCGMNSALRLRFSKILSAFASLRLGVKNFLAGWLKRLEAINNAVNAVLDKFLAEVDHDAQL